MSTLHRQAMDHSSKKGKTISRKARARLESAVTSSPTSSRPSSRAPSRAASRATSPRGSRPVSPSSDQPSSTNTAESSESEEEPDTQDVDQLVEKMQDRDFFQGSAEDRNSIIRALANSLAFGHSDDTFDFDTVLPILAKCLSKQSGDHLKQTLRAISISAILTDDPDRIYQLFNEPLKRAIYGADTTESKTYALHALAAVTYAGAQSEDQVVAVLDFLIQAVKSDGDSLDSMDNAHVVTSAIQSWSLLSTLIDPDPLKYNEALEAFEDQLESTSSHVILAAANSIGLLCEQEYEPKELDEFGWPISSDKNEDIVDDVDSEQYHLEQSLPLKYRARRWQQIYDFFQGRKSIIEKILRDLSTSTMRKTKKEVRREIHSVCRDVLHTLEYPWRGPRFSTALADDIDNMKLVGHRLNKSGFVIDRWWKLHRYESIKYILQGGLQNHLTDCPYLPDILSSALVPPSRFHSLDNGDDQKFEDLVSDMERIST